MSDIDPEREPATPPDPASAGPAYRPPGTPGMPEKKAPLKGVGMAVGCLLAPPIALSMFFVVMAFSSGSPVWVVAGICLLQALVLGAIWKALLRATNWWMVLLGIAVAAGFYLLMVGLCGNSSGY